ncbi:MAG: hypothetical protein ABI972_08175 [Acidobacteriota bacterium]
MNPTDAPASPPLPKVRHRSPNYPGVSLKTAIEKIGKWYKADGLVASPRDAAIAHMGFEKFTGDAGRLLSALKSFGLVAEKDGRLKLTQRGIDIVARELLDAKRLAALKEAAVSPEIYKALLSEYRGKLPSDGTLKSELIAVRKFNPKAVSDFIRDFKATLACAGMLEGVTLELEHNEGSGADGERLDEEIEQPAVGDYVQWECYGQIQFPEPRRIRAFSDDEAYAFVDGSNTGLPVDELTIMQTPTDLLPPPTPPIPPGTPKANPLEAPKMRSYSWALSGDFNAKLDLYGEATADEDIDALSDYVEITIKALKRSLKARSEEAKG